MIKDGSSPSQVSKLHKKEEMILQFRDETFDTTDGNRHRELLVETRVDLSALRTETRIL